MLLECVQLVLQELRRLLGLREVGKGLGELVHCPPHVPLILLHLLSIQLHKRPCRGGGKEGGGEKEREGRRGMQREGGRGGGGGIEGEEQ